MEIVRVIKTTINCFNSDYFRLERDIIKVAVTAASAYGIFQLWIYLTTEDYAYSDEETYHNTRRQVTISTLHEVPRILDLEQRLGRICQLHDRGRTHCRVLVLGLPGSGKNTFARSFGQNRTLPKLPGSNVLDLHVSHINRGRNSVTLWEVGRSVIGDCYWRRFMTNVDVICYVVDSADVSRFPEARNQLKLILQEEESGGMPVVIVASKQDDLLAAPVDLVYKHVMSDPLQHRRVYLVGMNSWEDEDEDEEDDDELTEVFEIFKDLSRRI